MPSPHTDSPNRPAVLLVDDRPENLVALDAVLAPLAEETGMRLLHAGTAEEALRCLLREDGSIAVILLDVVMPGTDGLETARLIRARRASEHLPIIFITALDVDRRKATLGYQFGAVDYLIKPIAPDVLRAKVRTFLDLHRRRGEEILDARRRYADEMHAVREAALRDETALIATIQRIGSALASELDLERIAQLVTDEATALTGAEFGAFLFRNVAEQGSDSATYTLLAHAGIGRGRLDGFLESGAMRLFGATFGAEGAGVIRSDDVTRDARYATLAPHRGTPFERLPVRSYLAVPVRSRTGEVLGGLCFGDANAGVFTEREERLVVGVAGWAAVAMDNARLYAGERQARESAEAAARTKTEFLATMSHEFRTPLNAVLGYAQLLELGVLGPNTAAQQAHLERLQSSARHLLGLIDDVLDVAKVDADRLVVRRDRLLTGAVVAAAVAVVQPQATTKGVRLIDLGSGDAGVPYIGDEHRARQVLVNLLANAVKFTPSGGEVTVQCGEANEPEPGVWRGGPAEARPHGDRGWAFVRITDTGPGISPELFGRLFEPFVQGDPALTRTHGGTGLGLAISRRLARLMHGDLVARSQPGAGATFTLWLPRAADVVARSEAGTGLPTEVRESGTAPSARAERARRTPAPGVPAIAGASAAQMGDDAYDVLYALAVRLAAEAETVAVRYVAALRADGRFPGARALSSVQLRDHATPFIGLVASQLMIIGETRGEAPELLGDGAQIQRAMAELHGAQRYRLGWSEADIEREGPLLVAETERALEAALSTAAIGGAGDADSAAAGAPSEAARAAAEYAAVAARQMLERGMATALRAHRFAKATSTP